MKCLSIVIDILKIENIRLQTKYKIIITLERVKSKFFLLVLRVVPQTKVVCWNMVKKAKSYLLHFKQTKSCRD